MARHINLDELLTVIDKRNGRLPLWLDEILTEDCKVHDAEPVIRCKNCKHNVANRTPDPLDETDYTDITCAYFMTDGMSGNDFCSRAEPIMEGD